jgi:hypothetical protein
MVEIFENIFLSVNRTNFVLKILNLYPFQNGYIIFQIANFVGDFGMIKMLPFYAW